MTHIADPFLRAFVQVAICIAGLCVAMPLLAGSFVLSLLIVRSVAWRMNDLRMELRERRIDRMRELTGGMCG